MSVRSTAGSWPWTQNPERPCGTLLPWINRSLIRSRERHASPEEMVLIGNAGSEYAVRGYLSAYDAETGKLVWRTYTVPGDPARGFESKALEEAAKTWKGKWWEAGGGGTPWDSIVYDPEMDLVYTGTANGIAWYRGLRGEGDSLYSASILAVRAKDGELVWYFQPT